MLTKPGILLGAASLALLCAAPVEAREPATSPDEFFSRTAPLEVLATFRGGADLQEFNFVSVDGALHSNTAANTINGTNTITNGAFANATGMATAIQNSGNNVLIQNATIFRIQLQ
jgi:hypothetical protein